MKPKSATVLLLSPDGRILGVSRGEDTTDWGMPGGWIEPGETPREAAARELWEETGILVDPQDLNPVYEQGGCVTFMPFRVRLRGSYRRGLPFNLDLEPQGQWEGYPAWVEPSAIACSSCTFGRSNGRMLRDLGLL